MAKAEYLETRRDVPPWLLAAAKANGAAAPRLEPRLLERVVAAGYVVLGGERLWLGGALSSLVWVVGGGCLFLLARRLASDLAGAVAIAFYLFLPYSVLASRSFQPDPAMVAFMIAALLAFLRHDDAPNKRSLVVASALAAVAVLVKPVSIFPLVAGVLVLTVGRHGLRQAVIRRQTLLPLALGVVPVVGVYAYGVATSAGLGSQAEASFIPSLLAERFFWRGWLEFVNLTVGALPTIVALASVVVARTRDARALMAGLLLGYVVYGLIFTYHIHTHDYYHLPLIPIVGLGLGLTVDSAVAQVRRLEVAPSMKAAFLLVLMPLPALLLWRAVEVARPPSSPAAAETVALAQSLGEATGHSTKVVLLSQGSGEHLTYHGDFAALVWPSVRSGHFRAAQLQGRPPFSGVDELDRLIREGAEWFAIADEAELENQPELLPLLESRGRLTALGEGYLLYHLRSSLASS